MASGMDMKAARSTYEGFIGLIKFSIPAIGAVTALVGVPAFLWLLNAGRHAEVR